MFAHLRTLFVLMLTALLGHGAALAADVDGDGVPDANDVCCNTLPGSYVDAEGRPFGDADGDCDVDLWDYAIFQFNFTGPSSCSPEVCDGIDNDCDCVVDNVGTVACGTGACYNVVQVCSNGVPQSCTPLPASPETCNGIDDNCNGTVDDPFDLSSDENNCGTCGYVCTGLPNALPECQAGNCTFFCDPDYADCNVNSVDGCEVYTPSDPNNCGNCGMTCPSGANATPLCSASQCSFFCNPNYADCDSIPANGCEANLSNNVQHCGTCNNLCTAPANATSSCAAFNCSYSCNAGFSDCNGIPADGCEINTQSNAANCGACGNVCPPRPNSFSICSSGNCQLICNSGYLNCNGNLTDGCEVNVQTDPQNCGNCGNACVTGAICAAGICTIP